MNEILARNKILVRNESFVWERPADHPESIRYFTNAKADVLTPRSMQRLLDGIDCDGLLKPSELLTLDKGSALLFEDCLGDPISADLAPMPMRAFIPLACQLIRNLARVHTGGYVHNYVCPDAILYDREKNAATFFRFERLTKTNQFKLPAGQLISDPQYLQFTSPEGTGRTGKSTDNRSDLYSLGAVFYFLVTGLPPFPSFDTLSTIHSHLAVEPRNPSQLNPGIPQAIALIILKLLAKQPEDRYQGAHGLIKDLEFLAEQLDKRESLEQLSDFAPGRFDQRGVFHTPTELFGRDEQIADLESASLETGASAGSIAVLVAGESGAGKTALVQAYAERWRAERGGNYVYGKYDAVVRSPYQAVLQALGQFASQALSGPEAAMESWRSRILESTPIGARLFAELIPEFSELVGDLPNLEPLGPTERDSRFKLAVHDLFVALASADTPLLLCLDDLQWADSGSLETLDRLLRAKVPHLTFVGAYRSGAEDGNSALTTFLDSAAHRQVRLDRLNASEVGNLLRGSFLVERRSDAPGSDSVDMPMEFVQLVSNKTEGNPLFIFELLESLKQQRAFWYDELEGAWQWDLEAVQREAVSGGVAALLHEKLERLTDDGRAILGSASCIGFDFEESQLEIISSRSRDENQQALDDADRIGLIYRVSGRNQGWIFAHEQIRERVYSQLSQEEKEECHYRLGLEYMHSTLREKRDDLLFQAMNHLLIGQDRLQQEDIGSFIETAMAAARVAKRTAAYESALTYLASISGFFGPESWDDRYEKRLEFGLAHLEAYYLNHQFEEAQEAGDKLLIRVREPVDRAKVYQLRVMTQTFLMHYDKAIEAAVEGLTDLGVKNRGNLRIGFAFAVVKTLWVERQIDLHHLDEQTPITDETAQAALRILFDVAPAAFLHQKILSVTLGLKMFHLMVKHGINAYGLYGASYVSFIHSVVFKNYAKGWDIANSVLAMRDRFPTDSSYKSNFLLAYSTVLMWAKTPYEQMIPLINEGFENSQRAAQVTFTGYYADILLQLDLYMGRSVELLAERRRQYQPLSNRLQFRELEITLETTGRVLHFLTDEAPQQTGHVPLEPVDYALEERAEDVLERGFFCLDYLIVALIFCDRDLGEHCVAQLDTLWEFQSAGHNRAEYLTLSCLQLGAVPKNRKRVRKLKKYRKELVKLATLSKRAHGHRALIAEAELAALSGKFSEACALYQEALEACEERSILHMAGIIAERAAQLCGDAGLLKQRDDYLTIAYRHFDAYGARAKTNEIVQRFPALGRLSSAGQPASDFPSWRSVDADAVTRASKALFEEVGMEQLIDRLLILAMETAGATRGCLFLDTKKGGLGLASEAWVDEAEIRLAEHHDSVPIADLEDSKYALDVVRTVVETGTAVLLDDASKDQRFDLAANGARSILCLPIVDRGKHHAALYLENQLTSSAFAPERITVLEILLSLAAISMTNASLYAQQENSLQLERTARESLVELNDLKDEFLANTSHELRTPLNGIIGLADSMLSGDFGALSDASKANLNLIVGSGRRLASLVNDILDFTRLQKRELEIYPRSVDVEAMVSLVCRLLGADTKRLGKRRLVNDVPEGITVLADENRFQQILFNLVGNAIKFTEADGTVKLEAEPHGDVAVIRVVDDGIGISSDQLEGIFVAFEQVDASAERKSGGTGLGLPLTKQLVELHGGELTVTSESSVGSVFAFTLPLSKQLPEELNVPTVAHISVEEARMAASPVDVGGITKQPDEANYHVLVVDDEPVNLRVLENYLGPAGYAVTSASSGAECLRLLEGGLAVNLVLLDVMMPQMTGYETCRQIRRKHSAVDLPVILLTAKNRLEDLQAGFDSGANDYIPKPFARQELLARMGTHLDLANMTSAYSRFVPLEIVQFLNRESILDVQLGDNAPMDLTVLFLDIRSYTTLAEGMTPNEAFGFLISLFQRIGPIIEDCGGLVNQFLGDGFMALFPGAPDDAVTAAVRAQQEVQRFNAKRIFDHEKPIDIGIGMHTGPVILGIIGDKYRRSGNVVSDTVNLASRVEGLTKTYGAKIAASAETLSEARHIDTGAYRLLDEVRVKGREAPVVVHEIFAGDDEQQFILKRATRSQFEQAVRMYRNEQFVTAQESLTAILNQNPQDGAAKLLLERCEHYAAHGVPLNWGGIEEMKEK